MIDPKLVSHLTIEELAFRWKKSKGWIYSNYKRMGLKTLPLGQHLRFRLTEVEKWEEQELR